ncbi:MAG TPA: sigma-70 family RNA polymerase sigma factor [Rhizomicrobium sp.]|jgi:RNA polymerase sigma-70 factor (ECF subfamily)|nr:sigma-70 family RNA polymerase sigma factor [Rhizomicrobium sp.]
MTERRRRFEAQALPHLDAAHNLARWLTRSSADADDVVQEAMLRAWRGYDGFRGGDIRPWLLTIVRNCWHDSTKDRRRRGHVPLPGEDAAPLWNKGDELVHEGPSPEAAALTRDTGRKLDGVIAGLPEEFREVLVLREMEDLSYREIASVTGAPIGTVMSRLSRARALLREAWLGEIEGGTRHAV